MSDQIIKGISNEELVLGGAGAIALLMASKGQLLPFVEKHPTLVIGGTAAVVAYFWWKNTSWDELFKDLFNIGKDVAEVVVDEGVKVEEDLRHKGQTAVEDLLGLNSPSDPPDVNFKIPGQYSVGWRWCNKCGEMHLNSGNAFKLCPKGGVHQPNFSNDYLVPKTPGVNSALDRIGVLVLEDPRKPDPYKEYRKTMTFSHCTRCSGLIWVNGTVSVCYDGQPHIRDSNVFYMKPIVEKGVSDGVKNRKQWQWGWVLCDSCNVICFKDGAQFCPKTKAEHTYSALWRFQMPYTQDGELMSQAKALTAVVNTVTDAEAKHYEVLSQLAKYKNCLSRNDGDATRCVDMDRKFDPNSEEYKRATGYYDPPPPPPPPMTPAEQKAYDDARAAQQAARDYYNSHRAKK